MGLSRARLLIPALAVLAALAAVAAEPPATPAPTAVPVTVRFVEPGPKGLVAGETRITLAAAATDGDGIARIEVSIDGRLLTILTRPPYTFTWNAGTGASVRVLRAVATDTAGHTGKVSLTVRPLPIGQYEEVRLVNVFATVRDSRDRAVLDLARDDFTITEDGVPQTISHFTSARVPLTVALLIDASNSMNLGGKISLARKAAGEFVDSVDSDDRLMVLPFNDRLTGDEEPVTDHRRLRKAIDAIAAEGGTALYDAVYRATGLFVGIEGRRAIVLLSDGRDQALTENEPGSLHLFEEALEKAHRAEVAIFAVGLGNHLETELTLDRTRSLLEVLETFAQQSGGRFYNPSRPGQLSAIYREIAAGLKQQYLLAYTSANPARDGRWRSIAVRVGRPGLAVQARTGYYAPGPAAP